MIDIQNALTVGNCTNAITLSTQLYQSTYTNNDVRMLYASAQACNMGIQLYTLIQNIGQANLGSPDDIFKTLVKLFPSKAATDSNLQSSWYAIDALQSILNPGAVVAPENLTYAGSNNPGSIKYQDRTDDANTYLVFLSMATVGTSLNRYGYGPADDPATLGYNKVLALPWTSQALVQADATYAACSLASGMYNMFDSIQAVGNIVSSSLGAALSGVTNLLKAGMDLQGIADCMAIYGVGATTQCNAGIARLRFRGACVEQGPSAAAAGGVIKVINAGWL